MSTARVVVLGAATGIGREIAALLRRRAEIELCVTVPSEEHALRWPDVEEVVVDLRNCRRAVIEDLARAADVLVLCAGVEYVGPAVSEPPGAFEEMLVINASGPIAVARAGAAEMVTRGRGLILGIGSIVAHDPRPFLAAYSASKATLWAYLSALGAELRDTGVEVHLLDLGPVSTRLGVHGPANVTPDADSPLRAAYDDARRLADRERAASVRTAGDVAREVTGVIDRHLTERHGLGTERPPGR